MKYGYALLLTALSATPAFAQPTLDAANLAPSLGSMYRVQYCDYLSPGTAGEEQLWDFSAAVANESHTITFTAPGTTPNGGDFPSATWAQEYDAPSGFFGYVSFNADGSNALGSDLIGLGYTHYSDPVHEMDFPLTYNDSWSDTFEGELVGFTGTGTLSGSVSGVADGYGTLILPYGTFSNVLRVHLLKNTEQIIVTPEPGATSNIGDDGYAFFKPGLATQLCSSSVTTNVSSIGTTSSSAFLYLDETSTGIVEARQQDIGIQLAPNPASDVLSMTFGAIGPVQLSVFDDLGRRVMATDLGALSSGIHRRPLDVSTLCPGHYLVRLTTADGQTGMRSFVVDRR